MCVCNFMSYLNLISTRRYNSCNGHLVTSYRSGFITTDYIDTTKSLNRGQLLDDGLPLSHPHDTQRQGYRGYNR